MIERAARKFIDDEHPNFDLVTLCPPATFGPLRHTIARIDDLNESNARLWRYCFATTSDSPVPYIPVHTYVDVRVRTRTPFLFAPGVPSKLDHG